MFFRAQNPETGRMWDTWLFWHEGTNYLYYLANRPNCRWDNISMATSRDGVHWQELGPVLKKEDRVTWMGTGSTWKSPDFERDGKFQINFSWEIGPRQTIWFAESTDLVHWTPLGDKKEFVQDERWYERNGRWDCIWTIARPEGGLYGYWTASPRKDTGGQFGFGETLDGVTWKALPPPKVEGVGHGEVGAIEPVGNRWYMMFGSGGNMWALVADSPHGPFKTTAKNPVLLHAGPTYFARFYRHPDGLLVNHHSITRGREVHMGSIKTARVDAEGTLRLGWWKGNEAMKHEAVPVKTPAPATNGVAVFEGTLDARRGFILEGSLRRPGPGAAAGLWVECRDGKAAAMVLDSDGRVRLGPATADGAFEKVEMHVAREVTWRDPAAVRLLVQGSLAEFFLDDVLVECFSLPAEATGRLGVVGQSGTAVMESPAAWH